MDRDITRRDFLNGIAVGAGGLVASLLAPWHGGRTRCGTCVAVTWGTGDASAAPKRRVRRMRQGIIRLRCTGMRGSHPGSYEVAHAMRDGTFWKTAGSPVQHRRALRSRGGGRWHQRVVSRAFLPGAQPVGAHPHPRQPRRLRRPREAQRISAAAAACYSPTAARGRSSRLSTTVKPRPMA